MPVTESSILVIPKPPSTWATVTFASVASDSGGVPACDRPTDSAIVKQDACAAPSSSSGLVPVPLSKRPEKL